MILGNTLITEEFIQPFISENIKSCSIDLTLDNEFLFISEHPKFDIPIDLTKPLGYYKKTSKKRNNGIKYSNEVILGSNNFCLGSTIEKIKIPKDYCGIIMGRSSYARRGIIVESAGMIDPGFEGTITLELYNQTSRPMILKPGIRICQLLIFKVDGCTIGYGDLETSKYQNQQGVTGSKGHKDIEFYNKEE